MFSLLWTAKSFKYYVLLKKIITKLTEELQNICFVYSNFPVTGTNTLTYCPTRVYYSQEYLNGTTCRRESGDCQGETQRPEEGNEAEKRECGCGRVVLWNSMR